MSTSRLHMEQALLTQINFESIDNSIRSYDMDEEGANALLAIPDDRLKQLVKIYQTVKPLLNAAVLLPIIPPAWRAVLQLFVTTLDGINASFKAGKDLDPATA
ncbi:MAG TPA: hypothetical protein VII75_01185 [Thermoanaerobaculia bacterium]